MKIIVDTNIIFSSLLSKKSHISDALLSKNYNFYLPNYAFVELFKHKEKIISLSKLSEEEVIELLYRLLKNIEIINEEMLTGGSLKKAFELVKDIDEKDIIFVALTIELNGLLWSGDTKLINGLKSKGFNEFYYYQPSKP
jgi:predicted nucleic acid-binding protein